MMTSMEMQSPSSSPSPFCCDFEGQERTIASGTCFAIERVIKEPLLWQPAALDWLESDLELVYGIGPQTSAKLRTAGCNSLEQLLDHPRFGADAARTLEDIRERNILALLNRGVRDADLLSFYKPQHLVFMDIETTSLYNSLPLFLVGMLFAEDDHLVLKQFFARHYCEEKALIELAYQELATVPVMVTYNGRSFDVPYLNARAAAHRLDIRLHHIHLDLLPHTRRKYRGTLPNCRLHTVGEALLGMDRSSDIPGDLIPQIYHDFVQTQNPDLIRNVLEHNAMDLISLARILPDLA
jgi:uncharacterized protein YprB with RNaseH-like and TPR domain